MQKKLFHRTGDQISALGLGCMRFPEQNNRIDRDCARQIIDLAISRGINYFDTAYVYQNGDSETLLGELLPRYSRRDYFLATKMPGFRFAEGQTQKEYLAHVRDVFEEQLRRCRVDYFDFYLCHNVCEDTIDRFIDGGTISFLEEMQREGKIRNLGFSSHGRPDTLRRFASLRAWDFGQLQINYLDWTNQDAAQQYRILTERNIPIIVMEPLRGGRLCSLGDEGDAILRAARPDASIPSWAFRFLQGLPNIQVVLSGMSNTEQLCENADIYDCPAPLDASEQTALQAAVEAYRRMNCIPCTGCHYCDGCPQEIAIPDIFSAFSRARAYGDQEASEALYNHSAIGHPSSCIACGNCISLCPQKLDIPSLMQKISQAYPLEN